MMFVIIMMSTMTILFILACFNQAFECSLLSRGQLLDTRSSRDAGSATKP